MAISVGPTLFDWLRQREAFMEGDENRYFCAMDVPSSAGTTEIHLRSMTKRGQGGCLKGDHNGISLQGTLKRRFRTCVRFCRFSGLWAFGGLQGRVRGNGFDVSLLTTAGE